MSNASIVYKSTDAGAPQLSGQVGSLVALLDAVLVDGYGVGDSAKPGAGWTRELVAQNRRAYRNDPVAGTGFYLDVNDSAQVGTARYAVVRGYSALRSFGDGDSPTPRVSQVAAGCVVGKSRELSGTSSSWVIVADSRSFYLFINSSATTPAGQRAPYFFGDFKSYKAVDPQAWCVCFCGLTTYTGSEDFDGLIFSTGNALNNVDASRPALYLPNSADLPFDAVPGFLVGGYRLNQGRPWNTAASQVSAYPNPVTQGLLYLPVLIMEGVARPRGELPGVLVPLHVRPFADLSVQPVPPELLAANSLLALNYANAFAPRSLGIDDIGQILLLEGGGWW
ncbi:hypothetical protein [Stenotrophomonas geniculata]|uniref:hypothetical protein n=1 Tax=Stenotrophomonas geniculata TaxID=86188 RepID=UPI002E77DBE1|nr:hypothetical protein [Stenotrophomonas geniculata]